MAIADIDPDAFYTVEQAAKMLMEIEPWLTYEEAYREVCKAVDSGKLKPAGYMLPR